jgi:hypothetical protein
MTTAQNRVQATPLPKAALSTMRGSILQRQCACGGTPGVSGECEECRKKREAASLQRAAIDRSPAGRVPPVVGEVLRSSSQALAPEARSFMEPRFGHDFSQVRVHTDAKAAESARAVNALAYTVGHDIVFGSGQYAPHSRDGQKLIAHELTHTIQQARSGASALDCAQLQIDDAASPAERESEATAEAVMNASTFLAPLAAGVAHPIAGAVALQRKVSQDLPRIKVLVLKGGGFGEKDAHEMLGLFKGLTDDDLRDTVKALEIENKDYIERFLTHISKADRQSDFDAIRRVKNMRYWKTETTTTNRTTGEKTTVTTEVTGSCSPDQARKVFQAATTGLAWLDTAVSQLDAYLVKPGDKTTNNVEKALDLHFRDKTAVVAQHIRSRLDHIRQDIRGLKTLQIECHGDAWDETCADAGAYVSIANPEMVVFCPSFFGDNATGQAEIIVHEMAHAQVGGLHITDRAYRSDRLLTQLTTAEALTNADSYGLFTQQLGTGSDVKSTAAKDTPEDCEKDDWWKLLQAAIALAERWNRNLQVSLGGLSPAALQPPSTWGKYLGGATQGDIDRGKKAVNKVAARLGSPIDFECEPDGGGRCDKYLTYWYAIGDFHICPAWKAQKSEQDRAETLLAGLFGYVGDVSDNTRQNNYAKLAREHNTGWAPPSSLGEVLGSSKWSPNEISIALIMTEPDPSKSYFWETGTQHERLSDVLPDYQVDATHAAPLPFQCRVEFSLDSGGQGRPTPFTPPAVKVDFEFVATGGGFQESHSDARPIYKGSGQDLVTKMPKEYHFSFSKEGLLRMHFHLDDPDAQISRDVDDTVRIKAA